MSELASVITMAVAIIATMGFGVQALGKWFDLQTARINKELAKSKNADAERQIESQSQARSETATPTGSDSRRWFRRYLWREQKSTIAFLLIMFLGPLLWGMFVLGPTTTPPSYVFGVAYLSPLFYILVIKRSDKPEANAFEKSADIGDGLVGGAGEDGRCRFGEVFV